MNNRCKLDEEVLVVLTLYTILLILYRCFGKVPKVMPFRAEFDENVVAKVCQTRYRSRGSPCIVIKNRISEIFPT